MGVNEDRVARVEAMILRMFKGESLKRIIDSEQMHPAEFFKTVYGTPGLSESYSQAQKARAELMVEETVEITDEEPDPQRARVRIDARRWYASKMQPQKYGEKLDLNVNQTVDIGLALKEARKRLLPESDPTMDSSGQLIESIAIKLPLPSGHEPEPIETKTPSEIEDDIFS